MNEKNISQHSLTETIAYHLLPGVVILAGYVLITPFLRNAGLPSAMGISLIVLLVLIPLELGHFVLARQKAKWKIFVGRDCSQS